MKIMPLQILQMTLFVFMFTRITSTADNTTFNVTNSTNSNVKGSTKIPYNKELLYSGYNDDYFSLYFDGKLFHFLNEFSFLEKVGLFLLYVVTETFLLKTLTVVLPPTVFQFTILPVSFYFIYILYLNFGGLWAVSLFIIRSIIEISRIL